MPWLKNAIAFALLALAVGMVAMWVFPAMLTPFVTALGQVPAENIKPLTDQFEKIISILDGVVTSLISMFGIAVGIIINQRVKGGNGKPDPRLDAKLDALEKAIKSKENGNE